MSLTAATLWALLRSLLIAGLALPVCAGLARFLSDRRGLEAEDRGWRIEDRQQNRRPPAIL